MDVSVKLEQVTKKYGKKCAIHSLSVDFEKGKVYGVLGTNGSGKSTLLKLITGLVFPTTGEVRILGENTGRKSISNVSYLTELDMFYDNSSVEEVVKFMGSQFSDFDLSKANLLVDELSLDRKAIMKQLSKGNRGRLKLVVTLARKSPIILLDEPLSGLDPLVRESVITSLVKYVDFDHQTMIIATHELDEIETLVDEVLLMNEGNLIEKATVESVQELGLSLNQWVKQTIRGKLA
ncbi:ABC transporter ATP-binding protein [Mangrovibacillus cuniculi]|uniref:ABC transporter ATP-binding protein n=1 Tax=Mangrovibacillus cuniculi TaxID=2593652 RepID=A0A7S8CBM6_9BACI|nr:ABC transporter ATP-binding protein [Mangrovibacillus cuniculi]QPC47004.1 ABC transporter ATP-binding protein [Mangrovibacillus cuniculi]